MNRVPGTDRGRGSRAEAVTPGYLVTLSAYPAGLREPMDACRLCRDTADPPFEPVFRTACCSHGFNINDSWVQNHVPQCGTAAPPLALSDKCPWWQSWLVPTRRPRHCPHDGCLSPVPRGRARRLAPTACLRKSCHDVATCTMQFDLGFVTVQHYVALALQSRCAMLLPRQLACHFVITNNSARLFAPSL